MNIAKIWFFLCLMGCFRFASYCGKLYSRHLFFLTEDLYPASLYCSWQQNSYFGPSKGRLNHPTTYIAKWSNKGQWIQVDLGSVAKVTKIGTQGRYNQWVSKYTVSYSVNGGYFENQLDKLSDVRRVSSKFHFVIGRQETMI